MTTLRCDESFLRRRLVVQLTIALAVAAIFSFWSIIMGIGMLIIVGSPIICLWWIWSRFRFSYGDGTLRTQKLFTKDIDVLTPIAKVQSVSAYEGIFEALCDVGTIEFSTASSDADQAIFVWPGIRGHRKLAEVLNNELKTLRSRA